MGRRQVPLGAAPGSRGLVTEGPGLAHECALRWGARGCGCSHPGLEAGQSWPQVAGRLPCPAARRRMARRPPDQGYPATPGPLPAPTTTLPASPEMQLLPETSQWLPGGPPGPGCGRRRGGCGPGPSGAPLQEAPWAPESQAVPSAGPVGHTPACGEQSGCGQEGRASLSLSVCDWPQLTCCLWASVSPSVKAQKGNGPRRRPWRPALATYCRSVPRGSAWGKLSGRGHPGTAPIHLGFSARGA